MTPYEETNRKIHGFNVALDKAFVRSASKGYTTVVPEPMLDSVTYFFPTICRCRRPS
ncbi:MlaA family lipoprotein [Jhaorihella thermophila]